MGASSTGGTAGAGAAATGGVGGQAGSTDAGGVGGSDAGTDASTCLPSQGKAVAQPITLFVTVDRSGSMVSDNSRANVETGINQFTSSVDGAGVEMALNFTPLLSGQPSCDGSGYTTPVVSVGVLPANAGAIAGALASSSLTGQSELAGALIGGTKLTTDYATANPARQVSLVVFTDFKNPDACSPGPGQMSGVANLAWTGSFSASTWVITMPQTDVAPLASVAAAGGTDAPLAASTVLEVKDALRRAAVPCRFQLPSLPPGGALKVSQTFLTGTKALSQVLGPQACASGSEWFGQNGSIVLCPKTCFDVGLTTGSAIEFTVTCA